MRPLALLAALALAACSPGERGEDSASAAAPPAPPAAPEAPGEKPDVALDGDGLRLIVLGGAARPLPFGTDEEEVMETLRNVQPEAPERSSNAECGAGPLDFAAWPSGLQLVFQDDRFVGWSVRAPGTDLATMSGVGVGSTRAALTAAYQARVTQGTLGTEFSAGGLGGLLSGPAADAKVTNLWAGTICAFR